MRLIQWIPQDLQSAWAAVQEMPRIEGLIIASLFLIIALIVRFLLSRVLRLFILIPKSSINDLIIGDLRKPIFISILFFGFSIAIKVSQFAAGEDTASNICMSIIIGSWMKALFNLSTKILNLIAKLSPRFTIVEARTIPLLDLCSKLVVLLAGSYALLIVWNINPLGWLASAGIVGIAVGFAAKDTLANLFSGFFILVDSPYKIGDYVNLDSGERGCVTHIGLRSTRILSRDDIEITLPNAMIANSKIVNESGGLHSHIRITIPVGVAYGSDSDQVCAILTTIADEHSGICLDSAPRVRLRKFGASSLDFELLGWISKPEDRGRIKHEILLSIYKAFRAEGIEIPYTKMDVHIKQLPDNPTNNTQQ